MPDIKGNSIHFPFLTCIFKVNSALYWCLNYDQPDIFLSDFEKWLSIQIYSADEQSDINICYYSVAFCNLWNKKKKTHIWKQADVRAGLNLPIWVILVSFSKRLNLVPLRSIGDRVGLPVCLSWMQRYCQLCSQNRDVGCGWWHKRQSTVQMGTLGFWVSVQTIWSVITERINCELYTVIFIGVAFQNILQKYCKVSDVSELVSSPLPQIELLRPPKPEPRQLIYGSKLHDLAS